MLIFPIPYSPFNSNSQPEEIDGYVKVENRARQHPQKLDHDVDVIDLTSDDDEGHENERTRSPTSGSPNPAPGPSTAVKISALRVASCDLSPDGIRGSNLRPAAQAGSSPIVHPYKIRLCLSKQDSPVSEHQLTSTSVPTPDAASGGSGGDGSLGLQEESEESLQKAKAQIETLEKALEKASQENAALKNEVMDAQNSFVASSSEVQELKLAVEKAADDVAELQENLEAQAAKTEETSQKYNRALGSAQSEKTARKQAEKRVTNLDNFAKNAHTAALRSKLREEKTQKQLSDAQLQLEAAMDATKQADDRTAQAEFALKAALAEIQNKKSANDDLEKQLKEAANKALNATLQAAQFQKNWSHAEGRVVAANEATIAAGKREQEANDKLKSAESIIATEIKLRDEALGRVLQAQLATREAKATVETLETAIAAKVTELKKLGEEKDLAGKQAAEREAELKKTIAATEAALKSVKAANACYEKDLAAKDEKIKALTISSQLAKETKNNASKLDSYIRQGLADQARISELETENSKCFKRCKDMEEDFTDLFCEIASVEDLEAQVEKSNGENKVLKHKLQIANNNYDRMKTRAYAAEDELDAYKKNDKKKDNNLDRRPDDHHRKRKSDDSPETKRNKKKSRRSVDLREELRNNSYRRDGSSSKSPPASDRSAERVYEQRQQQVQQAFVPPTDPRPRRPMITIKDTNNNEKEEGECTPRALPKNFYLPKN